MTKPNPDENHPFWRFSLSVYARPGVDRACLDLQDRLGLDVNLVLFALWAGAACGVRLDPAEMTRLADAVAGWRAEVVEPLRRVRRHLKGVPGVEPLRLRVKAAELDAERRQQNLLGERSGLVPAHAPAATARAAAEANLRLLLPEGADPAAVALLLDAATRND